MNTSDGIFSVKGFMSYGALVNNDDRVVAPLGELSVYAQTFARDRKIFAKGSGGPSNTAVRASVFSHHYNGQPYPIPSQYGQFLADMGAWIYSEANDGNFGPNPEVFRQALQSEFTGFITDIQVGPIVQQGPIYLPEHLTFLLVPESLIAGDVPDELAVSRIKLWFSDAAFVAQYDEFDFEFIAPIDRLDDFFRTRTQVETDVRARTQTELVQKIGVLADGDPYTGLINEMFEFRDPDDPTYRLDTNWIIVYYGAAGNNIDAIKEALIDWILGQSVHSREEWAEIFPDIFTSTEFIITPLWTHYAIPNRTTDPGMYSPTVSIPYAQTVARGTCLGTGYTEQHIDDNTAVLNTTYKSLAALITGGPDNRDGLSQFYDVYRDYLAVPTVSIDFDRMSPETQGWVHRLYDLLFVAESMDEYSDVPSGMTRLRRRDAQDREILYVVSSYQNVQYLVVSKLSMNLHFPPRDIAPLQLTVQGHVGVTTMDAGVVGSLYTTTFVAVGGLAPYTYQLFGPIPGALDQWSIDPVTGEFSALFTAPGDFEVGVQVTDEDGRVEQVVFDLHIEASGP